MLPQFARFTKWSELDDPISDSEFIYVRLDAIIAIEVEPLTRLIIGPAAACREICIRESPHDVFAAMYDTAKAAEPGP